MTLQCIENCVVTFVESKLCSCSALYSTGWHVVFLWWKKSDWHSSPALSVWPLPPPWTRASPWSWWYWRSWGSWCSFDYVGDVGDAVEVLMVFAVVSITSILFGRASINLGFLGHYNPFGSFVNTYGLLGRVGPFPVPLGQYVPFGLWAYFGLWAPKRLLI